MMEVFFPNMLWELAWTKLFSKLFAAVLPDKPSRVKRPARSLKPRHWIGMRTLRHNTISNQKQIVTKLPHKTCA